MKRRITITVSVLIALGLSLAGIVTLIGEEAQSSISETFPAFKDVEDLKRYLRSFQREWTAWTLMASGTAEDAGGAITHHSQTNIQVQGVDEADMVKTDGKYLYIAQVDAISIVKAYPLDQLSNHSYIDIKEILHLGSNESALINGIFLMRGRLVAVVSIVTYHHHPHDYNLFWREESSSEGESPLRDMPQVTCYCSGMEEHCLVLSFFLLDGIPNFLGFKGTSGHYVTSRMVDEVLYLVTQQYVWSDTKNVSIPCLFEKNSASALEASTIRYDPECNDPYSFLNVLAVDVISLEHSLESILTSYSSLIYVSPNSLYLTFQKWKEKYASTINIFPLRSGNQPIASINDPSFTSIYKFSLQGLNVKFQARGDVPGHPLNQFSLDESRGMLRVATTLSWSNQMSNVYVLDTNLNVIGKLEGLAPEERIYACRYICNTLYLVTFRQIDPLCVIDLTDPIHPILKGELKVPGFSSYLHPLDYGRLAGLGMENGSVKISLFDVSNPEHPEEIDSFLVGTWSYSEALWEHKFVIYDPNSKFLMIPISFYCEERGKMLNELCIFDFSHENIKLKGAILPESGELILRAQFIEDHIYAITDRAIYVHSMEDLALEAMLIYRERVQGGLSWHAFEIVAGGYQGSDDR
ncbi:MAG: beta-propeller domain-containing protein [Methanomassiliicoccales archaeon]